MAQTIKLRRGLESAIPVTGLTIGEPLYTTDRFNLLIADSTTTTKPATPNINELTAFSAPAVTDLLMMQDTDAAGQREKKITFSDFKTALNIPTTSTDEKVAATNGSAAGYLDEVLISSSGALTFTVAVADLDADIADLGVTTAHIANDAVTTIKIAAGAVDTTELAASAVTSAKIADGTIVSADIAADTIAASNMVNTFLDLDTSVFSGTGIDTQLTVTTIDGGSF